MVGVVANYKELLLDGRGGYGGWGCMGVWGGFVMVGNWDG